MLCSKIFLYKSFQISLTLFDFAKCIIGSNALMLVGIVAGLVIVTIIITENIINCINKKYSSKHFYLKITNLIVLVKSCVFTSTCFAAQWWFFHPVTLSKRYWKKRSVPSVHHQILWPQFLLNCWMD